MSIPRWIRRRVPNLVPIGPAVWQLPQILKYLLPKTLHVPPCVSRGNLFGIYPFPDESAHVCQIWCQSAQPFDSFSQIFAQVSSAFRRCTRWLVQKHAKKQHLYIENFNSGTNFLHSNYRSVQWCARGGVNDILPTCKNWIIYID